MNTAIAMALSDDVLEIRPPLRPPLRPGSMQKSKSNDDVDYVAFKRNGRARLIGYKPRADKVVLSGSDSVSEDEQDEVGDEHTVESSAPSHDRESIRYDRGSRKSTEEDMIEGDELTTRRQGGRGREDRSLRRKWKPRKPRPAKGMRRKSRSRTRERKSAKIWD